MSGIAIFWAAWGALCALILCIGALFAGLGWMQEKRNEAAYMNERREYANALRKFGAELRRDAYWFSGDGGYELLDTVGRYLSDHGDFDASAARDAYRERVSKKGGAS